uniref:Uncharacterized protein n=1 Tax=Magallana gigas TaxID=29159 RepID=A0A8W8IYA3_MAGGI|nr:uncharacterized protein LOC109617208 [Crassostrea gigas]
MKYPTIPTKRSSNRLSRRTLRCLSKEVYGFLALLAICTTTIGTFLLIFGLKKILIFDTLSTEVLVASGAFFILFGGLLLCLSIVIYQRERRKKNICCWCCQDNEDDEWVYGIEDDASVSLSGSSYIDYEMTTIKPESARHFNDASFKCGCSCWLCDNLNSDTNLPKSLM